VITLKVNIWRHPIDGVLRADITVHDAAQGVMAIDATPPRELIENTKPEDHALIVAHCVGDALTVYLNARGLP
jgi:hypothetical protein